MDSQRILIAAVACLSLLCSCAGNSNPVQQQSDLQAAQAQLIDAASLEGRPGRSIDGIGFHLLDRELHVQSDWQGLDVSGNLAGGFSLTCDNASPDDIFLAVTYDDGSLQLDRALLDKAAAESNLLLAVARRSPGLLFVGITRTDERTAPRTAMKLARLSFSPGTERLWRSASLVNEDPMSAVQLEAQSIEGQYFISWEERNIGDYDNNGLVSITDITPLGQMFKQSLAGADDVDAFRLVDGDGNGEINLADLAPISRNFNRSISGFSLYGLNAQTDDTSQLNAEQQPLVNRQELFDSLSPLERKHRLRYEHTEQESFQHARSIAVRPRSSDGSEGLFSNIIVIPQAQSPVVINGELQAVPSTAGVRISVPRASGPEAQQFSYELGYRLSLVGGGYDTLAGFTDNDFADAADSLLVDAFILQAGETYDLRLEVVNSGPLGGSSVKHLFGLRIPALAVDNDELWDNPGADTGHSGFTFGVSAEIPYEAAWQYELEATDNGRHNSPVVAPDGRLMLARGQAVMLLEMADGSAQKYFDYSAGDFRPAFTATDDYARFVIADGESIWYGQYPAQPDTLSVASSADPLLLDYLMVLGQPDGGLWLRNFSGGAVQQFPGNGSATQLLASNGLSVAQLCDDGSLRWMSTMTPSIIDSFTVSQQAADDRAMMLFSDLTHCLLLRDDGAVELYPDAGSSPMHTFPPTGSPDHLVASTLLQSDNYFVIGQRDGADGSLRSYRSDSGYPLNWERDIQCLGISACPGRIFIDTGSGISILDASGRQLQQIPLSSPVDSDLVLSDAALSFIDDATLHHYRLAETDNPPVWQGSIGLRELEVGDGQVTLQWDSAVDEHGEPVHYAVYYGAAGPDPDSPFTTVVSDIPDAGAATHEYTVDGLDNGTRYWFLVRAYDGWWDSEPDLELNQNWLAATPPWLSEELVLGDELPSGEIFYIRGIADPSGLLHLVYNDEMTTQLTHVFGAAGNWQHESAGLAGWPSNAFDLGWDTDLLIARAHNAPSGLSLLERTAADSFSETALGGSVPLANPQLSIARGTETGLAWTEYASGSLPQIVGHYYFTETSGAGFLPPVAVEQPLENYGRDLDLIYNPADAGDPWLAFQRGPVQTDNRLTPVDGTLHFRRDLGSGMAIEDIDLGDNPGESDVGKRVSMEADSHGNPQLVYYDLDSDPLQPRGQLKHARWDGTQWIVSVLENRDLSFQDQFTYRHTAPELDLAKGSGRLAIGELLRSSMPVATDMPHSVGVRAWIDNGSGFELEILTDTLWMLPSDREPCVALYDSDNILHIFVATARQPAEGEPWVADTILHLWRGGAQP